MYFSCNKIDVRYQFYKIFNMSNYCSDLWFNRYAMSLNSNENYWIIILDTYVYIHIPVYTHGVNFNGGVQCFMNIRKCLYVDVAMYGKLDEVDERRWTRVALSPSTMNDKKNLATLFGMI